MQPYASAHDVGSRMSAIHPRRWAVSRVQLYKGEADAGAGGAGAGERRGGAPAAARQPVQPGPRACWRRSRGGQPRARGRAGARGGARRGRGPKPGAPLRLAGAPQPLAVAGARRAARGPGAAEPAQQHVLLKGSSEEGDCLLRRVQRGFARTVQRRLSAQPCPRRPTLLPARPARNFFGVGRPIKLGQRPARRTPRATPRARAQ